MCSSTWSLENPGETGELPKRIAFYLPQFHPIPENDRWWGPGFTEWRNVMKARPLFPGHYQPHMPSELGFYDLRVPETREAQANLARQHGIYGFCYYHYWFHGERLLETLFNRVLESGAPDFPFALCWANEDWTRNWDARTGAVLIEQRHSHEDDLAHIRWLIKAFSDPRYIKMDGRPLMLIYRPKKLHDARRTTDLWREEAQKAGFPNLYLAKVESHGDYDPPGPFASVPTLDSFLGLPRDS
jgi:lipopolysaccharide biosynthesis protein